ncbi:hypothetical protein J1N35_037743 [Gossypium stocksii]|uniref:Uncharacterized protein n=1 Tax=Gossypium stocksii TaxID=47602 RepID=A0A9D3ULC9_9ROSI|nr:hypothetical protein J1N35_037743 [Gossypium stocksii]
MATKTLDDKKPKENEVKDKENEEGSKEVLEKQMEVEEKENEEEEKRKEEEEEESEDEGTKKVKGRSRKWSSRKSGRYSTEKKGPVAPSSDRPTRERKVVERYSAPSVARSSSSKTPSIEKDPSVILDFHYHHLNTLLYQFGFNETFDGVLLAFEVHGLISRGGLPSGKIYGFNIRGVAKVGGLVSFEACMDVMDLLYEKEETSLLFSAPRSLAASILACFQSE